jgi:hypothetical protein
MGELGHGNLLAFHGTTTQAPWYDIDQMYVPQTEEEIQWWAEFDAAAKRPLKQRFKYAFIKTYKPVMDDAPYRTFETMADYRKWCEDNLPSWLGYGR